jgi:hypothetical protein
MSNPTLQSLYARMAPWPDAQGSPTAGVHDAVFEAYQKAKRMEGINARERETATRCGC